jgi:hypothetical protein
MAARRVLTREGPAGQVQLQRTRNFHEPAGQHFPWSEPALSASGAASRRAQGHSDISTTQRYGPRVSLVVATYNRPPAPAKIGSSPDTPRSLDTYGRSPPFDRIAEVSVLNP